MSARALRRILSLTARALSTSVYHGVPPLAWGLVIWCAWPWFAVPAFGGHALSYWHAVGLGLLVRALRPRLDRARPAREDAEPQTADIWRWWYLAHVIQPAYSLALLAVVRWFA